MTVKRKKKHKAKKPSSLSELMARLSELEAINRNLMDRIGVLEHRMVSWPPYQHEQPKYPFWYPQITCGGVWQQ